MAMRLTFLGTGTSQGVPMIGCHCEVCRSTDPRDKRLRTSLLIECDGGRMVIDAGPDFRYQMLRSGTEDIDAILLSHEHKDHTGGIDDVRAINFFQHKEIGIYATKRTADAVRKDFDYAFGANKYPGAPMISLNEIATDRPFMLCGMEVMPIVGSHSLLPVTGYRIGEMAYLTDFKYIEDSEVEKLMGVKLLIVNALRPQPHPSHFALSEAIALAERVGAERTYFTHASHEMGLYHIVEPTLPSGMHLAYDGLTIEI